MESFQIVHQVKVDGKELGLDNFNMSSINPMGDEHLCVVLRGLHDVILIYKIKKRSITKSYFLEDANIVSVSANHEWVCLGFHNGRCCKVSLRNFINGRMLKNLQDIQLKENFQLKENALNSSVLLGETLIWSSGRSIIHCNIKKDEAGMLQSYNERNVREIVPSFDEKLFFVSFQCSPEIHIHKMDSKERLFYFSCHNDILSCSPAALNVDLRVSCMCSVDNMLWVGTGSGHILIYEVCKQENAFSTVLLQTLHPYINEMRKLVLVPMTQSRADGVNHLIVSTGKELNEKAFGTGSFFDFTGQVPKDQTAIDQNLCKIVDADESEGKVILVWHVLAAHQYKNLSLA